MNPEEEDEEDGANIDLDSQRKGKCVVLKTSTRQTFFLPVVGLVDPDNLKPGDLVRVNKGSYLILDTLPSEYDSRVKAMEVDEKTTEDYNDIGGLEKKIQELMFIGDGAKLVRDAFQLAKEKSPCIIFIDEIDAIGTKRFDSEVGGDREVQRTMLELLNQLDGFSSDDQTKVFPPA
ncbi:hypothetical protein RDI58_019938 [Solanum bulbocastanum]|uniref:Uncharacterized protein n=1 Tax=Solanum bulbocastanum TaxID=147425 RepID=A0AAN8Y7F0_SOLBU